MNKLTIGFAIHSLSGGGAERVVSVLTSFFVKKNYKVYLINNLCVTNEYPLDVRVKRHFIGQNVSHFRPLASLQRIFRLRQFCRESKLDILVTFMGMNEYGVIATLGLRTNNIISIRVAPEILYHTYIKRLCIRTLLSFASGAVFQTETAKRWFPIKLQQKSAVIGNPIWSNFYSVERKVKNGLLVASGRLSAQKNYPMLLKAIAIVLKYQRVKLEIYGKGEEESKLKALVFELGITDNVTFCGNTDDMPSVLSRADIFLLASDYEGLPNALMEAMAVGVPCIATDCIGGGSRMLIGNCERGILCPINDENVFAGSILRLLNDETLKERLGDTAKKYATRYLPDNCCKSWEKYINDVYNKSIVL